MKRISFFSVLAAAALTVIPQLLTGTLQAADELKIGWGRSDVTPAGPTMLAGQFFHRLALRVHDPISATAMALESGKEKVIMISLDSVGFRQPLMNAVREKVSKLTGVPQLNIIGFVTHTHTAPQYGDVIPKSHWAKTYKSRRGHGNNGIDIAEIRKKHPDFVDSEQYFDFLVKQISAAACEAWKKRVPGKIAYGLGSAAVGECRRIVVKDQGGKIYVPEDTPGLLHSEGHVDHTLGVMATYTPAGKLTGLIINVACPSQVSEAWEVISADFWHEVRQEVARRWGKDVFILPQCSPAGDISPHVLLNRKADERMMRLRGQLNGPAAVWDWGIRVRNQAYGLARRKEIARRISAALDDVLGAIVKTADARPKLKHTVKILQLPPRRITEAEYKKARETVEQLRLAMKESGQLYNGQLLHQLNVVRRYEQPAASFPMELHVIRLGNAVFATNSFELYLDYGDRIKGASKAEQTFLIQLAANTRGSYLPTKRSGTTGYGSAPSSSYVTYEGGDMIVAESVREINALFE